MSEKTKNAISTIDVESDGGIAEAFELAAKQGVAEISLRIPVPHGIVEKHGDAIDKLRARGTPIELIGSYILAEDWEKAHQAFRCCILELTYERFIELFEADVQFLPSTNLHRQETSDVLCMIIEKEIDQTIMQLSFDPTADSTPTEANVPRAKLLVGKVDAYTMILDVTDDANASAIGAIDRIVTDICNIVGSRIKAAQQMMDWSGAKTHLYVVPDLSITMIDSTEKKLSAAIAICGFRG
jgi:hypothetical protein